MIVVTAAEMRALDEETIQQIGVPGAVLMESAGRGVVEVIRGLFPSLLGLRAAVVAGAGNNGGDGFVVARHLRNHGAEVSILLCASQERVSGDARIHFDAALRSGVPLLDGSVDGFPESASLLAGAQVIVDALLGTGVKRPIEGHLAEVIARVNAAAGLRVAVDLPSGLDADRGHPLGTCVRADHTVTFAFPKLGLVTSPGFTYAGRLHVVDIGIAKIRAAAVRRLLLDEICIAPLQQPRQATGHKGTFGHALIVAGSQGHTGAALLAGEACARAGAGLVTLASPDGAQAALASRVVEVMTAALGREPWDGDAAWEVLAPLTHGKRAIGFGPGVPRDDGTARLLQLLLANWQGPLVIDADGLNLLARDLAPLDATSAQVVLTPHPAEMARLAGVGTDDVQADRVGVAEAFAARHRCVVVLKGARTVVASEGRTALNPTGNPGMGSGGTGDVLTGVISALLAQGMAPFAAACAGVFLHGRAGDLVRDAIGEAGLLARDIVEALPRARRPIP